MSNCTDLLRRRLGHAALFLFSLTPTVGAETLDWVRPFGVSTRIAVGVGADRLGNIYAAGNHEIFSDNSDLSHAFISKFDAAGILQWSQPIASDRYDSVSGVSIDQFGNAYVSGLTDGNLGGPNAGSEDAFIRKYSPSGSLIWTRQLGTSASDASTGVASDGAGAVYVTGYTQGNLSGPGAGGLDAWASKYDDSGNLLWTKQIGSSGFDSSLGISADGHGHVYITGSTDGSLNGPNAGKLDAFVSKLDDSGNVEWTRQFGGSGTDTGVGISADGLGNVYITSSTVEIPLSFLSKYDANGNELWMIPTKAFYSTAANAVSADGNGNVYVSGIGAHLGNAFVNKYDDSGAQIWTRNLAPQVTGASESVAADRIGHIYAAGWTADPDSTGAVAFVAKITDVPEPGTLKLLGAGVLLATIGRGQIHSRRSAKSK
jgi:Beta-propeller repeat